MLLAEGPARRIDELDLTLPAPTGRTFGPQDAVLFAGPVFGGRLSALMTQRLKNRTGEGTPAVTAAVYVNRAFEDALLELNDCVAAQGFRVAASAALVAERSISRAVPAVSETCTACGLRTAQCPARSISPDDPKHTDPERCFLCMRRIARCSQHAKAYPAKSKAMVDQRLAPLRTVRRKNALPV
nr:hypothetical protein [Flavonifractor sp. DFI.6.63]